MDKENSGNLDDILKELKNKMENSDNASSEISSQNDISANAEPINAELLKERLRAEFMSDSDGEGEETESGEYNIDNDLISEFYEEANSKEEIEELKEPQKPEEIILEEETQESVEEIILEESEVGVTEEELDVLETREGEIVEIVIPWVEQIEGVIEEEEGEEDIPEDFGGELNEDYFDAEAAENSYVCFAEDEGSDEEFFEQDEAFEEDDEDENDLPWYEDFPTSTAINEDYEEPVVVKESEEVFDEELQAEELTEEELTEEEPYMEETCSEEALRQEESFDEEIFIEEMHSLDQEPYEIILPIDEDEYDEEEDYIDLFMDQEEEDNLSLLGGRAESEENAEQMQISDLWTIEKAKAEQAAARKAKDEEENDSSSFYRMIIEEREKRESEYGYFSDKHDQASEEHVESEEVDIPEFNTKANTDSIQTDRDEKVKATEDFYGADEHDANFAEHKAHDGMPVFDYDHEETHGEVIGEADTNIVWRRVKPILMAVFALAILVLELLPVFEIVPDGILDYTSYPWTYIFIDAQLLMFAAALCYNKLFDGLLKLFSSEADVYSILSVNVIATLLSSILSGLGDSTPRLYNFISAAYLLAVYFFERIDKKRIKASIELLSNGSVFTLKRSQGKNSCAEKMYAGGLNPDTSILEPVEIENESFEGVFSRERVWKKKRFSNNLIVSSAIPIAIFSIFVAMISMVTSADLATMVNAFSFAFVLLAPLSATVAYYLPILISNKRLSKRGCVIAGYEGAEEISDCDAVVFADGHLFKECNASEAGIKLYCDESKTRDLFVCLGAVYSKLGGPMQNTFAAILGDEEHKVNMIRITRNGFEAVVDNRANIIVGSSDYLSRYGIVTDRADAKEQGVIYAAMNSSLCAKISVNYKTQPLFEQLSEILEEYGVKSVIQTYDPIVSGKYVAKCRGVTFSPISVVHKNINDYNFDGKHRAVLGKSGVFATSSRLKLVELLTFCKRITQLRKTNSALLVVSYSVAAVVCVLLSIFGGMEEMNLLWALLYQAIFVALSSAFTIRLLPLSFEGIQEKKAREELKKQEKENRLQYE